MSQRVAEKMVARSKAVQILKKLPVFDGLMEDEYFKVLSMCTSTNAKKGETLFKQGNDGTSMYILLSGEVEISVIGRGTVHVMRPGEILGEIGLVCDVKRTAGAIAKTDAVLLQLFSSILHDITSKYPRIGYVIMHNIAGILAARLAAKNRP